MKIKRAISLLVSIIVLLFTVVNEPLSFMVIQASELNEQEEATTEVESDTIQMDFTGANDNETLDDEESQVDDADIEGGEPIDNEDDDVDTQDDAEDETIVEKIEIEQRDSRLARAAGDVAINATNFPDAYFRAYVLREIDKKESSGVLTKAEINAVTWIDVREQLYIKSLKGIEHFTNLIGLTCRDNSISSIDLSKNLELKTLQISHNLLTSLDLSKNTKLTNLTCNNNQLTSLNLNNQTQLTHLECQGNKLSALDVSKATLLDWLDCSNNSITSLNLNANTKLDYVVCANNLLNNLDITNNTALSYLDCKNNRLTSLNTSQNVKLAGLSCENNKITSLNLSNNLKLCQVLCRNNALSVLEIPNNINSGYGLEYVEYEGQTGMTPSIVNAKAASDKSINVTWNAVAGANGYELYRYDNTYNNWERVAAKEIIGTSYSDKDVKLGETYRYKLYAFQKTSVTKQYLTYALGTSTSKTTVPAPQKLKTSIATATSISISWDRVNLVNGYMVYAATSKNGSYKNVGTTTGNSFTHTGLKPGTTYYYKVSSYVQLGAAKVQSAYSAGVSRKQIVPKVSGLKITNSGVDALKLSWNKIGGASGYQIYQATSKKGKYKKVATIKKGSTVTYTIKKLSHKKKYYFKIRAFKTVSKKNKTGKYSNVINKKVILAKPTLTAKAKSKTAINLKWKKVGGAKEYNIYRATSKKGNYQKIATTRSTKFTNKKLKKNKTYYYKIKAVQKINNKTYQSAYSTRVSTKTKK